LPVEYIGLDVIQALKPEPRIMRYELTDFEWAAIRSFLPNKPRRESVRSSVGIELSLDDLLSLWYQDLVHFWDSDGNQLQNRDAQEQDMVCLTFKGMAVLINSANNTSIAS
jgi:hypothetical protein